MASGIDRAVSPPLQHQAMVTHDAVDTLVVDGRRWIRFVINIVLTIE